MSASIPSATRRQALVATLASATPAIVERRFCGCTAIDALSGPLDRAIRLTEFAHQAASNAAFRGDELTPDALHGVFEILNHELLDLRELIQAHFALEVRA